MVPLLAAMELSDMRCSETCDLYTFWGGPILFWGVGHESYFFRGGVSDFVTVGEGGGGS